MRATIRALVFALAVAGVAHADEALERARAAYGADGWPAPAAHARDGLAVETLTLPDLEVRTRRVEPLEGAPVLTLGLAREGAADVELLVQIWIEDDAPAAREALLTWLSGCTRPLVRAGKDGVGEVSFEAPRGAAIAFARANFAAVVRFVGDGDGAELACKAARALDSEIIASSEVEKDRLATRIEVTRFAVSATKAITRAGAIALDLETRGEVAERAIRADRGLVGEDRGQLFFVPEAHRAMRIEVSLVSARGFRAKGALEVPAAERR